MIQFIRQSACHGARVGTLVLFWMCSRAGRGEAQTINTFSACTQGALSNCALIQLTSEIGAGPRGTNFFQIAISNLGSQTSPSTPTSIYNLVFGTGQDAAPGFEVDTAAVPMALGGAVIIDATPWDLFDSGDAIFLSALSNNGVGGCVAGDPVGGFSQSGQTCGDDQFLTFSFYTPRAYDPNQFSLLDLEVVGLTNDLPADSCNDATTCTISEPLVNTTTPEPNTTLLLITGLLSLVSARRLRKQRPR